MPSHEERAREILDGLAAFGHIGFHAGTTDADHAVSVVSDALAEVELEAYERAAKVAETEAEFRGEGDGEIWIASKIAQSIRDLAVKEGEG